MAVSHTDPSTAETISQLIRSASATFGDAVAVSLRERGLTYQELDDRSATLARGLLGRGVGKGTRVGVLLGNGPEWATWWAAISRIGAVIVPLSTFAKASELGRVIRHADLHGVVMQRRFLKQDFVRHLETAFPDLLGSDPRLRLSGCPYLRWVVELGGEPSSWAHDERWVAEDPVGEELLAAAEAELHPQDAAFVIYTSGQSAEPKGVVHSHGGVLTKVHYLRGILGFRRGTSVDASMPFFWVGGLVMALLPGLASGATVVCHDVSTFGSRGVIGRAGTPANPFEGADLVPSLGMTETFGMYSWGRDWRVPGFDLAAPLDVLQPDHAIKVVDPAGRPVADGERGEIVVRGPCVTVGLVKVRRDDVFDIDGYYRTGDEAEVRDGRVHFVGRLGDMIKSSGANVSPVEVERELAALEGVRDAYVAGLGDASLGQTVVAAVVPDDGASIDLHRLRGQLRSRISSYKVPKRIAVIEPADVPLTPSMKVERRMLAQLIDERAGPEIVASEAHPTV